MKNRLEKEDPVGNRFDELAKTLAGGLTRRKTLRLIGGSMLAGYLGMGRAWGAAPQSCKEVCGSLFFKGNEAAFSACTRACEDCKSCGGTPFYFGRSICNGAEPCRNARSKLTCCQGGTSCCGGVCCQAGADGANCCRDVCYEACPPGALRDPQTCNCGPVGGLLDWVLCVCLDQTRNEIGTQVGDCFSSPQVDAICVPACSTHGGLGATACIHDYPGCNA